MNDEINAFDVPYLEEILKYMPIDPIDDEDVNTYIQNIVNLIAVNYKYGQYQFAYFGLHLLYMTYIYCTVWKISKINPERYSDAVLFARPYDGKKVDLRNIESIFEYSNMPEKELPKIFKIIELDNPQIGMICTLVNIRNDMAHASGKFDILTEEIFYSNVSAIHSSIKNIHRCMEGQIRKLFSTILIKYVNGDYKYEKDDSEFIDAEPIEIIDQEMIQNYNLSSYELLVCNEMSLRALSD
ncbi:MAG: hypothetical protein GYA02_05585 [Clostridiaceae bacterium]|nr:hypothetical protein [Clostridiaceae bacterium]